VAELVPRLEARPNDTVFVALDLHEWKATPVVPVGVPVGSEAVVVSGGQLLGVALPTVSAPPPGSPGSESRGLDFTAPPVAQAGQTVQRGLVASVQGEIPIGTEVSLIVRIVGSTGAPDTAQFSAKVGDQLDLVVEPSAGLEIVGPAETSVAVDASQDIASRFKVRGKTEGDANLQVSAFLGSSRIAFAKVTTRVVTSATTDPPQHEVTAQILPVDPQADLQVYITEDKAARSYVLRVSSPRTALGLNTMKYGPITLDDTVEKFFSDFFSDIETILTSGGSPSDKADQLGARGTFLMRKVVPLELRQMLWKIRDSIQSIEIQSEEPWVPWELCKLWMDDGTGKITEDGFLCEKFLVTRWLPGVPQRSSLTASAIGLVVPSDSGLTAAEPERDYIAGLQTAGRTVTSIPAQTADLRQALAAATYDCLHFTGHGKFDPGNADRSSIRLEQDRRFTPEDVSGKVASLGQRHPLVFLNACEIGRSGTTLGGTAGWPQAFIGAGAGAFIGPYWKIGDGSAALFVQTFYDALLTDKVSVGDAVHRARLAARDATDPTWLSYVAYAHPGAKATT
jgi:hypothetical protein